MNLDSLLTSVGFSEKEAMVYLIVLKKPYLKASEIALLSNLKRPTAYDVLDSLLAKKVINLYTQSKVKKFFIENTSYLLDYLERQSKIFLQYKNKLENYLQDLETNNQINKFSAHLFIIKDKKDIIIKLKDFLKFNKSCNIYFDYKLQNKDVLEIIKTQLLYGDINIKVLLPNLSDNINIVNKYPNNFKILKDNTNYNSDTFIFDNSILFIDYFAEIQMSILTNSSFINTQKNIFNNLWNV